MFEAREHDLIARVAKAAVDPSFPDSAWRQALVRLSREVCGVVAPDPVARGDSLDVCDYVRVCVIPGGAAEESVSVAGAVLRKNLVHRAMPRTLEHPRIMLLETGIELERADAPRLSSLERVLDQERLYLELVARKIASVRVNVLLVGGTVARVAQDLLLERGVAVATLVSAQDLRWVARLTGALILPSTEYITRTVDPTGTCARFHVETKTTGAHARGLTSLNEPQPPPSRSDEKDTFMYFEGCPAKLGATICLRGEPFARLVKLREALVEICRRTWCARPWGQAFVHSPPLHTGRCGWSTPSSRRWTTLA
jgi:1-phosphatidylinositol-3-phosphate 5-kinase